MPAPDPPPGAGLSPLALVGAQWGGYKYRSTGGGFAELINLCLVSPGEANALWGGGSQPGADPRVGGSVGGARDPPLTSAPQKGLGWELGGAGSRGQRLSCGCSAPFGGEAGWVLRPPPAPPSFFFFIKIKMFLAGGLGLGLGLVAMA